MDQFEHLLAKLSQENPALQALVSDTEAFKRLASTKDKGSIKALNDLLHVLEAYESKKKFGGHLQAWFEPGTPYGIDKLPKHEAFFAAGAHYRIRAAIAANRTSKTTMAAYEAACHSTGKYPSWWKGKRFNRPIKVWACGISWGQVKEALQTKIYGLQGNPGTGMIAEDLIVNKSSASGIPGALESLTVKHVSGGNSIIAFKTYEQGIRAFQGAEVDFIIMDEEPPYDIFDECDVRLMTTGGLMVLTFTPQMGLTPTIVNLYQNADLLAGAEPLPAQVMLLAARQKNDSERVLKEAAYTKKTIAIVQISMYDVPWLTVEQIEDRKSKSPAHLRDSRIYGKVTVGEGTIYPVALDKISCAPFQVPKHWKRVFGMDVGWEVTACVWGALDPDDDVLYVYSEYKGEEKEPLMHASAIKARGDWIIGNIDYQAQTRNAETGKRLIDIYRQHGLKLVHADKAVDAGIMSVLERMTTGRLKIFSTCQHLLVEIPIYRRDKNGKIIKELDHQLDALRYLIMGLHNAKLPPSNSSGPKPTHKEYSF